MDRISADVVERVKLLTCVNHFLGKLLMLVPVLFYGLDYRWVMHVFPIVMMEYELAGDSELMMTIWE